MVTLNMGVSLAGMLHAQGDYLEAVAELCNVID